MRTTSKLLGMLGLLIGTAGCATMPIPRVSMGPPPEPPPVVVPAAECQMQAQARPQFQPPSLLPAPSLTTDPVHSEDGVGAAAAALQASRDYWRARARRSEPLASAVLEYLEIDRRTDADQDDLQNRCADEDAQEAQGLAAWSARNARLPR